MSDTSQRPKAAVAGIDVGGTFTDLVALDAEGIIKLAKVPSTLQNQAHGVLNALAAADCKPSELSLIVHGTTTTTNALLERNLARTGLITTAGFRDVLELGRRTRPQAYGMHGRFAPLIPRDLRLEVAERMDRDGNVLVPLDKTALRAAVRQLRDAGCEAIVVHFLHAYANPRHELEAIAEIQTLWPNDHITAGHQLLSENREYERGVTATVNACVQPLLQRYVQSLSDTLATQGYPGDLLVMNGNGGMVSARHVAKEAAKTVMSGPASGVMAAAYTARRAGIPNVITYDMGGTSTDVALIRDASPSVSNEIEVEYGMPIHVPMVDVRTVGAGGGSIAKINSGGLLDIGPQSAGATPGPICYGLGGTDPTISDANMLLGRLDPKGVSASSGGTKNKVQHIIETQIGKPLDLTATEAAAAIVQVANTKMAGAIRMVSLSLGADPRDFALFAFGGAGPLHACALAKELNIPRVLVPARPGLTNALGCVVADLRHDFVQTINAPLKTLKPTQIADIFFKQSAKGKQLVLNENIPITEIENHYSLDMQFVGQTHLLRVPLTEPTTSPEDLHSLFEAAYRARFHVDLREVQAAVVNVNCSVIGRRETLDLRQLFDPRKRKTTLKDAQTGTRDVFFDTNWHPTPVYGRDSLPETFTLIGPAIIEQLDTTIVVPPGDHVTPDHDGNLIITIAGAT
ncbi:hydantoinase/oxoprolinase family protein [Shimia sp. MMG029]|uniref:hydantoinase/oxoprolinase family protein n=1 Tax=Shimia sp. MMG029 TaxID=3021978 RepID=UPI0022FE14D3|nr:hydantoinase/oxoprolinase family protein [Shimia sp. MMG029]MDA5555909.1 hydantoinase/oxoprolinase family protein [Shimia sp. MMG029]